MRSLVEFFVRYRIWSNALLILIVLFGFVGFQTMNKSFFPETESRTILIQVVYPGASPQEMEEGVVLKVEESLKGIEGVDEILSVSQENLATVTVNGVRGYDVEELLQDVKNSVDRINSFPVDAEKPVVYIRKNTDRVMAMVLQGEVDLLTLKKQTELIEDEFLASGIMSQVSINGYPDREISIEISESDLNRYSLTFSQVANAIRINNTDITGGSIKTNEEELLIRANAKSYDAEGIGAIVIRSNPDGSLLRVRDVATNLEAQFADVPNKTLFNGQNAVTIRVQKLVTEDILEITDWLRDYVKDFNQSHSNMQLIITSDRSEGLMQRLNLLIENGLIGLLLVLVALGLFLSLRLSFWVAWGIPFSFLGMFFVASLAGVTINMISLFGMILVIGILVDDGIVVGENIYSHIEKGKSPARAAIDGSMEVLPAVFTSVSTTILFFGTFFFLQGRIGEFILEMAIVVIACLAFSLVECTFILPAHLGHKQSRSWLMKLFYSLFPKVEKMKAPKFAWRRYVENAIDFLRIKMYGSLLRLTIRYRYIAIAFSLSLFIITLGLMNGGYIGQTFFPFIDSDQTTINLALKPGTRENVTESYLEKIQEKVWELNQEMRQEFSLEDSLIVSTRLDIGSGGGESGGHAGTLEVSFLRDEGRILDSGELEKRIREKMPRIAEAEKFTVGGRRIFGKPVSISLVGRNLSELEAAKEDLKDSLRAFSALKDITDNNVAGKREIKIELKPDAYVLGLSHGEIARQVRQGFFGEEAQRLQIGKDEVKVWVRYPEKDRVTVGNLDQMKIKTLTGQEYPFSKVASYKIERDIVAINHYNGAREIKIEADLADQNTPVPPILEDVKSRVIPAILGQYAGVKIVYSGQEKESQEFGASARTALSVVFLLVILVISLTFRSLPQAITVLLMIPLGIMGAAWGHGIEGKPLSILSSYGLLALSGIVINDAVVLVAKYNRLLKEGVKLKEAAWQAGVSRFRAILLTSVTTVAGLYPLILAKSRQAQFLIPMAISVAYGVLIGTFFILTVFPPLLVVLNDIRVFLVWFFTGKVPEREIHEPSVKELDWEKRMISEGLLGGSSNGNASNGHSHQKEYVQDEN